MMLIYLARQKNTTAVLYSKVIFKYLIIRKNFAKVIDKYDQYLIEPKAFLTFLSLRRIIYFSLFVQKIICLQILKFTYRY